MGKSSHKWQEILNSPGFPRSYPGVPPPQRIPQADPASSRPAPWPAAFLRPLWGDATTGRCSWRRPLPAAGADVVWSHGDL